ncbi:MAG: hypothetical protein ACKO83_00545 [Roseiflexaceae bacterium]
MPNRKRPRHQYPTCYTSGKSRFDERKDAQQALTNARFVREMHEREGIASRRQECRVYRCEDCRGWHLTSRPEWQRAA